MAPIVYVMALQRLQQLMVLEERNIMRQTRHHSVNMVRRYINEANKFVDNPISTIFENDLDTIINQLI